MNNVLLECGRSLPVTDIHECLSAAAQSSAKGAAATTMRLGGYGRIAAKICQNNGTSLSAWVRKCCEALAKDYGISVDHEASPDAE